MSPLLSRSEARLRLLQALQQPGATVTAVCRECGLSRPTFYKWRRRFEHGGAPALADQARRPQHSPQAWGNHWQAELAVLRRRHPHWGAKKLRHLLRRQHPRTARLPALRTLERWLHAAGVTEARPPRARPGRRLPRPPLTQARGANDVWTIDFKGWCVLGDGRRCEPLTVRDLASRFVLAIAPLATANERGVRAALRPVFARWGLPAVIRVDNGSPFGGRHGPRNLSGLSVWWQRLGIRVEFIRPAKPQDNGAHEQMHRILKAETLTPPAANHRAQQRRFRRWQLEYNTVRPHEALGGRCPAQLYRRSPRPWHTPPPLHYPVGWLTRRVLGKGAIRFLGRTRNIGRAFAGETVGLQPLDPQRYEVYLGSLHLGTLHLQDLGAIRPCVFRTPPPRLRLPTPRQPLPKRQTVNHVAAGDRQPCRGGKV